MKTLGQKIKQYRIDNKISQTNLALMLGTSQQLLSKWEKDKFVPVLPFIIKMLKVFNITLEELLDDTDLENLKPHTLEKKN